MLCFVSLEGVLVARLTSPQGIPQTPFSHNPSIILYHIMADNSGVNCAELCCAGACKCFWICDKLPRALVAMFISWPPRQIFLFFFFLLTGRAVTGKNETFLNSYAGFFDRS